METVNGIEPSEYILAALPQQERLEIAFRIAQEAFQETSLSPDDIELAVKKIRKRLRKSAQKSKSRC